MKVIAASDTAALRPSLGAGWNAPADVVRQVGQILSDVRLRGDAAVCEYVRRFDDPQFEHSKLRVPIPMLGAARALVSKEVAGALESAKERIARFHERQRLPDITYVEEDGTRYALRRRALASVAVYAPRTAGATAVLMGAVPARIAGVPRVAVLSSAAWHEPPDALLFACALCGVDELYAVGGAQAIAAAAYGTDTISPFLKIVGRGSLWTTEAKRQVFGHCAIDTLAGPAEILVVADDGANSEYVVGELLARAELPNVARLAVLSESRPLLEAVAQLIDTLDLRSMEQHELVSDAIANRCSLIETSSREELFEMIDQIAPACLCLQVRDASAYLDRICSAGAVFVGDMTPLVCGEYLAGTSGIVPTSGTARFASSLSLGDFMKSFSVVENTLERMTNDAAALAWLAEADGLPYHAQTARMRGDT
jgi:histidinol dehydrogenase